MTETHYVNFRTFLAMLVAFAVVISAVPMMISGKPIVENAAAQTGNIVKVGWLSDFENWNPLTVEMVSDWVAYNLIYSTLFQYDEDWDAIENHLATGYYQVPGPGDTLNTYINISKNAYFRSADDPEDTSHPLTAFDVKYTIELIQANPGNAWDYYAFNITEVEPTDDGEPWDYDRTDNPYQVRIETEYPKATLIDDLVWVPILPQYIWEDMKGDVLGRMDPDQLVGSGPFYFEGTDMGSWYNFATAPNYHAEADYGEERDIDFDGIQYQVFTEVSGLAMAINQGSVDVVDVTGAQKSVWDSIASSQATVPVIKQVTTELGIYDIAINAIPEEIRTALDYADSGNRILLDPVVRKAIGMTLNRQELVDTYFWGLPTAADTVLNPGYWHADLPDPLPYNPEWARENLTDAGYEDTNADGILEVTASTLAYAEEWGNIGDPLEFKLHVPDSDPGYATVGTAWVSWAEEAGIKFDYDVLSEGKMTSIEWYECNYDLWVWSWYWGPEPLSNLACWRSEQIRVGGYNCVGPICEGGLDEPDGWWWIDEEEGTLRCGFDDLFDEALRTVDRDDRRALVQDLQIAIYETYTEFPPIHPNGLYAYTTARYDGWGDWETHVARTIISDMLWLWYDLEPTGSNVAPNFNTPPQDRYEAEVDVPITFAISVSDFEGDEIRVNWSAGDGSAPVYMNVTGDTTVATTVSWEHTYTEIEEVTLRVGLKDDSHTYETVELATVDVVPEANLGPYIASLYPNTWRAYVGDEVTWTVEASDHEQGPTGEGLTITWDWDDGSFTTTSYQPVGNDTLVEDVKTHSWEETGTHYIKVYVWDGYDEDTNTYHNVSASVVGGFLIRENLAPSEPMVSDISALEGQPVACEAISSDEDPDVLTFTWDWGDGTYNVTEHDTSLSLGAEVASTVKHTWTSTGTSDVTVYVDDGEGHNVSTTVTATVLASGENAPPGSITIMQTPNPATVDIEVVLRVGASDANGDALDVTIDFGDGEQDTGTTSGGTTDMQYVEFSHVYVDEDTYNVVVEVDDGVNDPVTASKDVLVVVNGPPVLNIADKYSFYYNQPKEIKPLSLNDPEMDQINVWYDWGDDTAMTLGDPDAYYAATHTYMDVGEFELIVYADDGKGNNVSATADVNVQEANRKPTIVGLIEKSAPVETKHMPGETIYFNVTVADKEGDNVTITMSFDDESSPVEIVRNLEPGVNETVTFTHIFEEGSLTPYIVRVVVEDDQEHSDMTWNSQTIQVSVEVTDSGVSDTVILVGIGILALLAAVAALMLLKRKRKGAPSRAADEMEGMTPSEVQELEPPPEGPPPSE